MEKEIQSLIIASLGVAPRFVKVVPQRWIVKSTARKYRAAILGSAFWKNSSLPRCRDRDAHDPERSGRRQRGVVAVARRAVGDDQ